MPAPQSGARTLKADAAGEHHRPLEDQRHRPARARVARGRRSAGSSPASARKSVVLPAPFGPTTASTSPACRSSASTREREARGGRAAHDAQLPRASQHGLAAHARLDLLERGERAGQREA